MIWLTLMMVLISGQVIWSQVGIKPFHLPVGRQRRFWAPTKQTNLKNQKLNFIYPYFKYMYSYPKKSVYRKKKVGQLQSFSMNTLFYKNFLKMDFNNLRRSKSSLDLFLALNTPHFYIVALMCECLWEEVIN